MTPDGEKTHKMSDKDVRIYTKHTSLAGVSFNFRNTFSINVFNVSMSSLLSANWFVTTGL
jgi:hypothetical protein